jgi:hypothetical protein
MIPLCWLRLLPDALVAQQMCTKRLLEQMKVSAHDVPSIFRQHVGRWTFCCLPKAGRRCCRTLGRASSKLNNAEKHSL